jgi:hypothetical protein
MRTPPSHFITGLEFTCFFLLVLCLTTASPIGFTKEELCGDNPIPFGEAINRTFHGFVRRDGRTEGPHPKRVAQHARARKNLQPRADVEYVEYNSVPTVEDTLIEIIEHDWWSNGDVTTVFYANLDYDAGQTWATCLCWVVNKAESEPESHWAENFKYSIGPDGRKMWMIAFWATAMGAAYRDALGDWQSAVSSFYTDNYYIAIREEEKAKVKELGVPYNGQKWGRGSPIDAFMTRFSQALAMTAHDNVYLFTKQSPSEPAKRSTWYGWEYPALTQSENVVNIWRVDSSPGILNPRVLLWKKGMKPIEREPRGDEGILSYTSNYADTPQASIYNDDPSDDPPSAEA